MTMRVFFDGLCAICRAAAPRLAALARPGAIELADFRTASDLDPALRARCESEMLLVFPDGRAFGGADAIVRALGTRRLWWAVLWVYFVPPVGWIARAAYRWIAAHRFRFSMASGECDGACAVHPQVPPANDSKLMVEVAPRAVRR